MTELSKVFLLSLKAKAFSITLANTCKRKVWKAAKEIWMINRPILNINLRKEKDVKRINFYVVKEIMSTAVIRKKKCLHYIHTQS